MLKVATLGFILGFFLLMAWPEQVRLTPRATGQAELDDGCDGGYIDHLVPLIRYRRASNGSLLLEYIFVSEEDAEAILQAQGGCEPPPEELPRCKPLEQITDI